MASPDSSPPATLSRADPVVLRFGEVVLSLSVSLKRARPAVGLGNTMGLALVLKPGVSRFKGVRVGKMVCLLTGYST